MSVLAVIVAILGAAQIKYLLLLILANLVLGIVSSMIGGDFRLTKLADWLVKRVLLLVAGYGAAALLAYAQPDMSYVRDAAYYTLGAALVGYVLANLKDMGVPLPDALAGKGSSGPAS